MFSTSLRSVCTRAIVDRLVAAIQRLKDRGNSVVVVEHEEAMLRAADRTHRDRACRGRPWRRGRLSGYTRRDAPPGASLTGEFLAGRRGISIPEAPPAHQPRLGQAVRRPWQQSAKPDRRVSARRAVPGHRCQRRGKKHARAGHAVRRTRAAARSKDCDEPLPYDDVVGDGQIDDVILVDQDPIGRSPRSNPVTYIKAFDPIRQVFAETIEARTHNYTAGHFSFNVEGGRCSACEGKGYIQIDMQFMTDIFMKCSQCDGTRYRKEILAVKYRGRNIAEVLAMTVREAFGFFRGQPKVQARLKQLIDVGLEYLQLGQPANTLSSGEAQRLKLAAHLSEALRATARCFFSTSRRPACISPTW